MYLLAALHLVVSLELLHPLLGCSASMASSSIPCSCIKGELLHLLLCIPASRTSQPASKVSSSLPLSSLRLPHLVTFLCLPQFSSCRVHMICSSSAPVPLSIRYAAALPLCLCDMQQICFFLNLPTRVLLEFIYIIMCGCTSGLRLVSIIYAVLVLCALCLCTID
jgi:hypothetical protein